MEPKIIDFDKMYLIGLSFFGDPFNSNAAWTEENEIGRLWKRFQAFMKNNADKVKGIIPGAGYEVHITNDETYSKGMWEIFVGVRINEVCDIPVDLLIKFIPENKYAVFTINGAEMNEDWCAKLIDDWIEKSKYKRSNNYMFELYDHRFKGMDKFEESEIDIYIPIEEK